MQLFNRHLTLEILPEERAYRLVSRQQHGGSLTASFAARVRLNNSPLTLHGGSSSESIPPIPQRFTTPAGRLPGLILTCLQSHPGISLKLHVGLHPEAPFAMLQLVLTNHSADTLSLERLTLCEVPAGRLQLSQEESPDPAFYSHGWASWSTTGAYGLGEKQRRSILGPLQNPMVINPDTPQPRKPNHLSGDMFGVLGDRRSRLGLLAGFLSQKAHFGSLEANLEPQPALAFWASGDSACIPPGETIPTDWAVLGFVDLDQPDPLGPYLDLVARFHEIHSHPPAPVGWCSWYHFYTDVTAQDVHQNLSAQTALQPELPLRLLQIDDGFETAPGDWFNVNAGFPEGLRPLAEEIKSRGLIPGLWLAPFILHPKAKIVQEHPDWLLRDKNGRPVRAGFVWNHLTLALDLTHPEALEYVCRVIRTAVSEWGFEYLKLDFLYAAALKGAYQDPTQTRAQVLRKGLEALRRAAGPTVPMLACGCPLGSALGLFEAMRISADVSGHWEPHFPPVSPLLRKEPHMPAARNALQNILTRAPLHQRWWVNDPDCLLIRPETNLTLAEVQTLATAIALTGGSMLLSDDLPALPEDRLRIAKALLPLIDQRARVIDWFDSPTPQRLRLNLNGPAGPWHLLAHFNWTGRPANAPFDPQTYHLPGEQSWWLRSFWDGCIAQQSPDLPCQLPPIPPHGVRLIALRPREETRPAYLGSDLHISQGVEICQWEQAASRSLTLALNLNRRADGAVALYLPWEVNAVRAENIGPLPIRDIGENRILLRVALPENAPLVLHIA